MKTAVLISGQMRTFAKCYPTQRWQIFRHYEPDIYFFVSCCDDAQADSASLLLRDYENVHCERLKDPDDLPSIPIQQGYHAPYANAASHAKLMLQHWGNKRVWEFFRSKAESTSFDTIIRIRPDIWIHRFQKPSVSTYFEIDLRTVLAPWWGKFGGINDRLAIVGKEAASIYFGLYDIIPTLLEKGCPFHPETLLAETLRTSGMNVENTLLTEFSTERMDGSRRWAEIVTSDMVEFIAATK
jgi:hypothetical protein